jgi:hypothetical protein
MMKKKVWSELTGMGSGKGRRSGRCRYSSSHPPTSPTWFQ